MLTIVFTLLALAHCGLLIISWRIDARGFPLVYIRLLLLALALDNAILALAPAMQGVQIYVLMSALRFWMHALLLPVLLVFVAMIIAAGITRAKARQLCFVAGLLAAAAIIYGYVFDLANLELVVADAYPRLVATDSRPPFATIFVNFLLLPSGIWLWRRRGWPWLFAGAMAIFLVNGASAGREWGFIAGNCVELLFSASLLATLWRFGPAANADQAVGAESSPA